MSIKSELIDELRNAIAHNKLFIITGAGISTGVTKEDGSKLPTWGQLIQSIRERAENEKIVFTDSEIELLDRLIPSEFLDEVHGDAYIEASQIIESKISQKERFSEWIREETTGKQGYFGDYHKFIEKLKPRGIATFNYDQCHENAYDAVNTPYEPVLYNEDIKLVKHLNSGFKDRTIILKAHGCISESKSIVLTSSSYNRLLNDSRVYRATIQHILSRFTILILGFSLRDRDFDQMLSTIEQEFGSSVQSHIAIMKKDCKSDNPNKEKERQVNISNYAVLESRYGLKILPTETHNESEDIIKGLYSVAGTWINDLSLEIISSDNMIRKNSREKIKELSEIGRRQLSALITQSIKDGDRGLSDRSEQLYLLGTLRTNELSILKIFLAEVENKSKVSEVSTTVDAEIECIAHSLVALRYFSVTNGGIFKDLERRLIGKPLLNRLEKLDEYLDRTDKNPRLVNYAKSAFSEIIARS
ncbi:SIR2 family NAD-dependent protein deacylase [Colwellia psychrerythraea]|uniref:Uncharacterized protein n=1 Tax=Colwellia psychrerythraea TaxID=28229 RepID=A0A099L0A8_COLPS|nr:SIR2 family protein [Colwellia psychrerythraea]KGJ95875.1 hypothetical protein GAB14E_1787 [Colwellia psychrerythraea]